MDSVYKYWYHLLNTYAERSDIKYDKPINNLLITKEKLEFMKQ